MEQIILEKGYSIQFDNIDSSSSIANIFDEPIILMKTEYTNQIHFMTTNHGVLIQIWCRSYQIRKIGKDE